MRARFKPWALPEIEVSEYVCMDADEYKANWSAFFEDSSLPLSLELGCGKGRFITKISQNRPNYNYLGVDIDNLTLAYANRKVEEIKPTNARLLKHDIANIDGFFGENEVSEIFINFPNPWPKKRQKKRRLTHPKQLVQYRLFLKEAGQIWFKTDDQDLYEASLEYFPLMGFKILDNTDNLITDEGEDPRSILTEYEERWRGEGVKIKAIYVEKVAADEDELREIAANYKDSPKQV